MKHYEINLIVTTNHGYGKRSNEIYRYSNLDEWCDDFNATPERCVLSNDALKIYNTIERDNVVREIDSAMYRPMILEIVEVEEGDDDILVRKIGSREL